MLQTTSLDHILIMSRRILTMLVRNRSHAEHVPTGNSWPAAAIVLAAWLVPWSLLCTSLLLTHRPVLFRHRGFGEVENPGLIRHKRHGLVHRIEIDGVVQEKKQGVGVGILLHLLQEQALLLTVDRV